MISVLKKITLGVCFIITAPMSTLYNISKSRSLFAGQGQLLALVPGKFGSYLRVSYYFKTLARCTQQGYIGFGSYFSHPEAELGTGYYIGAYTIIGKAIIGDHATIASHISILSGKNQHGYLEKGRPIQEQPGSFSTISIGENCWIGNNAVVMADLGQQTVVAAGSVVVAATQGMEVVGGNPAKVIKKIL